MRGKRGKRRKPEYNLIPPEHMREEPPFSHARIVPAPVCNKEKTASPLKPDPKISTVAVKNISPGKPYKQPASSTQIAKTTHVTRETENTRSIVLPNDKTRRGASGNAAKKPSRLSSINDPNSRRFNSKRKGKKPLRKSGYILISISVCVSALILLGIIYMPGILHFNTTAPQLLTTPYVLSAEDGASPSNMPYESADSISAVLPTPEINVLAAQPAPSESAAPSPTVKPTVAATPNATSKSTSAPTATPKSTPTPTTASTPTPTIAPTPTPTTAPTPTPTIAPIPTPTTAPTPTPTIMPTPTPTEVPSETPEPTVSPSS